MGYTHYFTFKKAPKGKASQIETNYQKALIDCQRIILAYSNVNGGLSGFSAHTKLGQYGGLNVNGSKEDGHETFVLREHFSQNESFNFCKTARKPYDTVVTACLIVLSYRLGACIDVSSDGDATDWTEGLRLAQKVLKLKRLQIPSGVSNRDNDSMDESA
jgi:hypothetical protein